MEQIIFKNICKEIMRECNNRGIKVSERFIAYYVKLLLLNPRWNISLDGLELNRIDLQQLVKHCYTALEDEYNPAVINLKMQMYFQCSFDTNVNIIFKYRKKLHTQLQPLEDEILNCKSIEEPDLRRLMKLIINFLTLKHGLGNPTSEQVYYEAEAALKSVFNREELLMFVTEPSNDKKLEQLDTLSKLVAGIRLFNGKVLKAGEGIEDLPTLLIQASEQTTEDCHKFLLNIMDFVNQLTTALDLSYVVEETKDSAVLKLSVTDEVKYSYYIYYFKNLLVLYRQLEVCVRKLIDEVVEVREKLEVIFEEFDRSLKDIYTTVHHKIMVPASIIYPQFTRLAHIWYVMQNEVIYLSNIHTILENLKVYSDQVPRYEDIILHLIGKNSVLTDADRMQNTGMYRMAALGCKETKILNPRKIPNFAQEPLEILGFCIWKFVESGGALLPGNPGNGVVQIKKRYYVFSCLQAVQEFVKDPEHYINRALEIARTKPELIHFLQLYSQLDEVKTIMELVPPVAIVTVTSDESVQTELHPVRPYIDREYSWDIWEWKRRALKLADISKRKTKSTQTDSSGCRSSIKVQTHYNRDHIYQTKKDAWANTPTPSTFIFGLRGRKDDKQFIITLTRPVEE